MIEFSEKQGNVLVLSARGTITPEDVDAASRDAESMLADYEAIGVVADMTGLESATPEAIAKDFATEFKFLGDWKRFPRIAVVSDAEWLDRLSGAVGAVLPDIDVRAYGIDDKDQALAFAEGVGADKIRA